MAQLADSIAVVGRYAKSANLERDVARPEPLDGYVVTARTLDVVERVVTAAATGRAGGAWSLTGPYGSGKSSLALLLDALLGEPGYSRQAALSLIDAVSPDIGDLARQAHQRYGTQRFCFNRGLVTAQREPLAHTILRALETAVQRRFGKIPPKSKFWAAGALRGALEDASSDDPRRTGPSPTALVDIARCLAEDAPLLLIIDEFGKNLEAIRDGGAEGDPYLLQQLAEAGQGSGLPIFLLTLQHLSFDDCLAGTADAQRREWAKVQGRFEDIAFVESPTQTRALIGTVFNVHDDHLRSRIKRWAKTHAKQMRSLGIVELADPELVAACYPLHPLAVLVLPELCNRYGQQERSLFSFLAGRVPKSASSFLANTSFTQRGSLPSLGLDEVYDYFVASDTLTAYAEGGDASRWIEIAVRLRDSHGLSSHQQRLLKAVSLLNLVSMSGVVRASKQLLRLVDNDADNTLTELEESGLVIYREFADEYRVWHGTDVDVRRLVDAARHQVERQPVVEVLSCVHEPRPLVAARHSSQHDMLRMFSVRYYDGGQVEPPNAFSQYDGEVLLSVGKEPVVPRLGASEAEAKPVVIAIPEDVTELAEAAREVQAILIVLDDPAVVEDRVARRELGERLAHARVAFDRATTDTFSATSCRWVLLNTDEGVELRTGRGSSALSEACDHVYRFTPAIGNEMLNRTDLTTQGSKARRLLLEGMIERSDKPDLGFEGYGPEMAMYRSFLNRTHIHVYESANADAFGRPSEESLGAAWDVMQAAFNRAKSRRTNLRDVYAALLLPPVGMKAAVLPVFVTAGLLASSDSIALYEHGTFKPLLTPEISERMVRNPGHFDIKHFANTSGARREVIRQLAIRLNIRPVRGKRRVANVLAIVGYLVSCVRQLDNYTVRTANLPETTRRVRETLLSAVEPDQLLFTALPEALGFKPIKASAKSYSAACSFADSVGKALDELGNCYETLLANVKKLLLDTSAENTRLAVCGQAAALEDEVLDPAIRAFVYALANDTVDGDADWMKGIATVVAKKAPAEWTDEDHLRFQRELPVQVAAFQRLLALHVERRVHGSRGFDALRVTITRPDGSEHIGLVAVDQAHRADLERSLNRVLEKFEDLTGSHQRANHALLALLSERLLPDHVQDNNHGYHEIGKYRYTNDEFGGEVSRYG